MFIREDKKNIDIKKNKKIPIFVAELVKNRAIMPDKIIKIVIMMKKVVSIKRKLSLLKITQDQKISLK